MLSAWNDQSRDVQVLLTRIILDKAKRYNAKNKETEPALQTPITNAYANRVDDLQQEAAFSSSSLEPSPRQFMGQPDSSDELYSSEIESGRGNLPGTLKRPSPLGSKSQQPSNSPPKRRKHSNSKAAAVEASEDQEAVLNRNSGVSQLPTLCMYDVLTVFESRTPGILHLRLSTLSNSVEMAITLYCFLLGYNETWNMMSSKRSSGRNSVA